MALGFNTNSKFLAGFPIALNSALVAHKGLGVAATRRPSGYHEITIQDVIKDPVQNQDVRLGVVQSHLFARQHWRRQRAAWRQWHSPQVISHELATRHWRRGRQRHAGK